MRRTATHISGAALVIQSDYRGQFCQFLRRNLKIPTIDLGVQYAFFILSLDHHN